MRTGCIAGGLGCDVRCSVAKTLAGTGHPLRQHLYAARGVALAAILTWVKQ